MVPLADTLNSVRDTRATKGVRVTELANVTYGRLKEAAHMSGYSFARTSEWLEALLADDSWQQVGPGFTDINVFLRSIDLSPFNIADSRPALVRRIKELQPDASNRAIASTTSVDEKTVRNDLKPPADYSAPEPGDMPSDLHENSTPADYSAPEPGLDFGGEQEAEEEPESAKPAGALQTCKRLLKRSAREQMEQAMRVENEAYAVLLRSPDAREALTAFLEKRKPDFTKSREPATAK